MIDVSGVVFFLFLVNGLPPIVSIIVGDRYSLAVDGGKLWLDGRPIFGSHKTIRGIAAGIAGGFLRPPCWESPGGLPVLQLFWP